MTLEDFNNLKIGDIVLMRCGLTSAWIECKILEIDHENQRTRLLWVETSTGIISYAYGVEMLRLKTNLKD